MSKIITIFGATGNQGGSVVRSILNDPALSKEFKIRGVTRDVSKPASQKLSDQGVEMISADMSSVEQAAPAVKDAHTVYFVTNYWESANEDTEISQGKAVADAAKAAGVKHLIFSSLIDTNKASNGRLTHIKHFEGKAKIEQYIRDIGVPATFVLPGFYMSNLFTMLNKGDNGYSWNLPVSGDKAQVPLFDAVGDSGKFVTAAIRHYPDSLSKRIYAATEYYTPSQVVSQFSEVTGKSAVFNQVPEDVFKSFLPPYMAQEMLENMLLLQDPGYYGGEDLKESVGLLSEKATTWKEFVEQNKSKWE